MTAVEREEVVLQCSTKDTRATVTWFKNGQKIQAMMGSKYETKTKSGTHQLLIRKLELTDQDTYEIETGGIRGSCKLTVLEGKRDGFSVVKTAIIYCHHSARNRFMFILTIVAFS